VNSITSDVLIIGAGPSGSVLAKLLTDQGISVQVVEAANFPRFVIGESLLPQCNEVLAKAGLLESVRRQADELGFQYKNGAVFECGEKKTSIDFREKFSAGAGETWQVRRADFDKLLADGATQAGVSIHYETKVVAVDFAEELKRVVTIGPLGEERVFYAKHVADASGYGRVLPRLLDLDVPSTLPSRSAYFTHVEDAIGDPDFSREKILITVHPENPQIWFWLIPFSDGRASVGVVGEAKFFAEESAMDILQTAIAETPTLAKVLKHAKWDTPAQQIGGYSIGIKNLQAPGYSILGNAGEFLDPVFSSGVTIALKSADFAAECITRELKGEAINWQQDYEDRLMVGVKAFRPYVMGWYSEVFQSLIFHEASRDPQNPITQMISSVLAGYAWDRANPFVKNSDRKLASTAAYVKSLD